MNKKKLLLIVQSLLCVILVVMLAVAALGIYRNGRALQTADPLSPIYSREKVAAALKPVLPLLLFGLVLTGAGLVLGIRDERTEKAKGLKIEPLKKEKRPQRSSRMLRAALLILALALIAAGVFNGSARDVFGKAVKICTECVGLG